MKIRSKLTLLTGVVLAGSLSIVVILLISLAPILRIQNEQKVITEMRNAESDLSITLLRFPLTNFEDARLDLTAAIERSEAAFDEIGKLEFLPSLSPQIVDALETIVRLEKLQIDQFAKVDDAVSEIVRNLDEILVIKINFKLRGLTENARIKKEDQAQLFGFLTATFDNASGSLLTVLDMTVATLDEQSEIIDTESQRIITRGIIAAGIIGSLLIVASIVLSMLMAKRIGSDVLSINRGMLALEQGKLTPKETLGSKDEIGELSMALARFNDSLAVSVRRIASAADDSRGAREELNGAAEQASSASEQMRSNAKSIESQISILDKNVNNSSSAINSITEDIKKTDTELDKQSELVEHTSSAITEMSASISNVGRLTEESGLATEELENAAHTGGEKLYETTRTVESIREDIDGVRNITGIIQAIASRTNLLAMNAAIEAAHAGDAGRGFAVVADEIRKLAEASAKNSKEIASLLAGMISSIQAADGAGQETRTAFETLLHRVSVVKRASDEIRSSMKELETGSGEIGRTMEQLSSVSTRVGESSASMRNQSESVQDGIGQLWRVSKEVNGGIGEISAGLTEVTQSMAHLLELSRKINHVSEELDSAVSVFDLVDEPLPQE